MVIFGQLGPQVVGVADVEQAAAALLDCDAAVSERMTEERNQQDFRRETQRYRSSIQSEPVSLRWPIGTPTRSMFELARDVSPMTRPGVGQLFLGHMHRRVRKVSESARVIGIAMREHDVAHLLGPKAKALNSPDSGIRFVELKPRHVDQLLPQPFHRILYIQQANACINQGQATLILQQETMTDDRRIAWNQQSSAIDMVNGDHRAGWFLRTHSNRDRSELYSNVGRTILSAETLADRIVRPTSWLPCC